MQRADSTSTTSSPSPPTTSSSSFRSPSIRATWKSRRSVRVLESANWFEREIKDWFGIIAFPEYLQAGVASRLARGRSPHAEGVRRRDTVAPRQGSFDFKRVEGEGVFEIPVGPVHAGIIEPGHFRFSVAGEPIINLDVQLFYTHKGTEKIAEGMTPQRAVFLAERISGDSSFAHALAYCHSIERMSGCEVPKRAVVGADDAPGTRATVQSHRRHRGDPARRGVCRRRRIRVRTQGDDSSASTKFSPEAGCSRGVAASGGSGGTRRRRLDKRDALAETLCTGEGSRSKTSWT